MKLLSTLLMATCFLGLVGCKAMTHLDALGLLKQQPWLLSSLSGEDLEEFSGQLPSLDFMESGKLSGFTGCNAFTGNFLMQDGAINLEPIAMTKRACPGSGEAHFVSTLEKVAQLKIDKEQLILLDEEGMELMTLVPQKHP